MAGSDDLTGKPGQRYAEVLECERVLTGFLRVDKALVRHSKYDGGEQTVTRMSMERGDSVGMLIINRRDRTVLLAEQFRYPTLSKTGGWIVELPAGACRDGEDPTDTAKREAEEETGCRVSELQKISTFYVSPGGTSERIVLFVAFVAPEPHAVGALAEPDDTEDIRVVYRPLEAFMDDAVSGRIEDAKTLVAGLWLKLNITRLGL